MSQNEQFILALLAAITSLLAVVVPVALVVLGKLDKAERDRVHVSNQVANTSAQVTELANGQTTSPATLSSPVLPPLLGANGANGAKK